MHREALSHLISQEEKRIRGIRPTLRGDPSFLPVYLTGGIGDAILARTTLDRLRQEGFQMLIYSQHAEAMRYFYKDQPVFKGELPDFTWCLHLDSIARFKFSTAFRGFLLSEHQKLFDQQQDLFKANAPLEYLVREHPEYKYALTAHAKEMGIDVTAFPLYSLGFKDIIRSKPLPRKPPKRQITIHDGYDANNLSMVHGRATKQWKWNHWNHLVSRLKWSFEGYRIIQLGTKTARVIDGTHECLVNNTTLEQAFDLISESAFHVDTDSGLVHAATELGVPCVVLFGPTPSSFYGHPQNTNLTSNKSCAGGCFFLTENWMDRCPVGYATPQCMDDITPDQVMKAIRVQPGQR